MSHLTLDNAVISVVIRELAILKARRQWSDAEIGRIVGYSADAIQKFRTGENPSSPLALALVSALPELGVTIPCPYCGKTLQNEP